MADWKQLLRGGFAGMTAPFAAHPNDEQRARRMFHVAVRSGVTLDEIIDEADTFLRAQGCTETYIEDQKRRIRQSPHNPQKKVQSKKAWLIT